MSKDVSYENRHFGISRLGRVHAESVGSTSFSHCLLSALSLPRASPTPFRLQAHAWNHESHVLSVNGDVHTLDKPLSASARLESCRPALLDTIAPGLMLSPEGRDAGYSTVLGTKCLIVVFAAISQDSSSDAL